MTDIHMYAVIDSAKKLLVDLTGNTRGPILAAMFINANEDRVCPCCHGWLVVTHEETIDLGDREIRIGSYEEPCPLCIAPPEPSFVTEIDELPI